MFDLLAKFNHKAEIRESKDEILIGEIVRAMARQGHVAIQFIAGGDLQRLCFRMRRDPVLTNVFITLDRKTGGGAIEAALLGSQASLTITGQVRNQIADPDDLLAMYRTDLANLFKLPVMGGIRLNHELDSVFATTTQFVNIDHYVLKGDAGTQGLTKLLDTTISRLRDSLKTYKKG